MDNPFPTSVIRRASRLAPCALALLAPLLAEPLAANDIRDIKPPVVIPSGWEWLPYAMAALAGLGVLYILWRWLRPNPEPPPPLIIPPHVRARNQLRQALGLIAQPKPFCVLVSDTLRLYLEERFEWHAPDRTTEEFLDETRTNTNLDPNQKQALGRFLTRCDLVKFARQTPAEPELRELLDIALRLVEQTIPAPSERPATGTSQRSTPQPALS